MPPKPAGTSGYTQNVVTINDYGLQERTRTNKATGKSQVRFTVTITGQPLAHLVDPREIGRRPAEAMADHLRRRIETIQELASPSTQLARKSAAVALSKGASWAMTRYAGGRTGAMVPNTSPRLFNDSGRLAKGLIARPVGESGRVGNKNEWVINVTKNRFDPTGLGGQSALLTVYAKLVELIPEFGDPAKLMRIGSVQAAITDSYKSILQRNNDLRGKLARARMGALAAAFRVFR